MAPPKMKSWSRHRYKRKVFAEKKGNNLPPVTLVCRQERHFRRRGKGLELRLHPSLY